MARRNQPPQRPAAATPPAAQPGSPPNNEGQTAVKGKIPVDTASNPLAQMLSSAIPGSASMTYTGCKLCRFNLDLYVQTEEGIQLQDIETCPNCRATFVDPTKIKCYSCSRNMTSSGNCLKCGAKHDDEFKLKAATVEVRTTQNVHAEAARILARQLLTDQSFATKIVARAKSNKTVERVEEGALLPFASEGGGHTPPTQLPPPRQSIVSAPNDDGRLQAAQTAVDTRPVTPSEADALVRELGGVSVNKIEEILNRQGLEGFLGQFHDGLAYYQLNTPRHRDALRFLRDHINPEQLIVLRSAMADYRQSLSGRRG
jgi:hypothetical protein